MGSREIRLSSISIWGDRPPNSRDARLCNYWAVCQCHESIRHLEKHTPNTQPRDRPSCPPNFDLREGYFNVRFTERPFRPCVLLKLGQVTTIPEFGSRLHPSFE